MKKIIKKSFSWKNNKLRKSHDFQKIIKNKKKFSNESFVFFYNYLNFKKKNEKEKDADCKFGISIPQKIVKKSHDRNKCKRRIKSIIIQFEKDTEFSKELKNWEFVIIMKENFLKVSFEKNKRLFREFVQFLLSFNLKWQRTTKKIQP